eukprot:6923352-Alexandrium_andersonii.AAC.1
MGRQWLRDLTQDGDVEPHPGPGSRLTAAARATAAEATRRATAAMATHMLQWLSRSQRRAEADT